MSFREDGRVQELLDENEALKKTNADLAKKYAAAQLSWLWQILIAVVPMLIAAALFGFIVAFSDRIFFNNGNPKMIAREVAAQIRQNPRPVYDRQWAAYFKEKIVMPAYREGVRAAREEFEASRLTETQARPVLSADGRDLTMLPIPPVLSLNTVIYGEIKPGKEDSYLFHAEAGERVVFRMQATTLLGSWLKPYLMMVDEYNRLSIAENGGEGYATVTHTFASAGTYVIFCGPYYTHENDNGSYTLSARHR